MKLVYEAANSLEAHMIVNLLEQQGVRADVNGAFLQGAMGELPAAGLIRVMVEDDDFTRGREIVQAWDAAQPPASAAGNQAAPAVRRGGAAFPALIGGVLGLLCGIVITAAHYKLPAQTDGFDYDGDGVLDETWTFSSQGSVVSTQSDRNLDGKIDERGTRLADGQIDKVESDLDFDGSFDTVATFKMGNQHQSESDTDKDGFRDTRFNFKHGVLTSIEFLYPATGLPQKIDYYEGLLLSHAHVDTDIDGKMDQRINFDKIGMITSAEPLR